jgi:hypothetical protein
MRQEKLSSKLNSCPLKEGGGEREREREGEREREREREI